MNYLVGMCYYLIATHYSFISNVTRGALEFSSLLCWFDFFPSYLQVPVPHPSSQMLSSSPPVSDLGSVQCFHPPHDEPVQDRRNFNNEENTQGSLVIT